MKIECELPVGSNVCGCRDCGMCFETVRGFDAHRVGAHDKGERRCLSEGEMSEKGMSRNSRGRWGLLDEKGRERLKNIKGKTND